MSVEGNGGIPGKVYLVGGGPGDPDLVTVKGVECLRKAQAVLFDGMINQLLLERYCSKAEWFDCSKRKGCCKRSQETILALMVEQARKGRTVVRLKGGDPMIFGRGGEEARALRQAGIPFEIVPGVSCLSAVPAYAGIPVTDRDYGSSLGVYTVHRRGGLCLPDEQWHSIAQGPDTLVFLMGKTRCGQVIGKLLEFGRPPSTPVAIIENGTLGHQSRVVGTLETLQGLEGGGAGPGLIVVGEVVRAIPLMDWFQDPALAEGPRLPTGPPALRILPTGVASSGEGG